MFRICVSLSNNGSVNFISRAFEKVKLFIAKIEYSGVELVSSYFFETREID